ncbi:MAG: hypothetical protein ACI8R9_002293 [Paraglaciecola sp.]|jgi:uncharacterized protein (DUF1499 family)
MNRKTQTILIISIFLTGCAGTMSKLGIENGQLRACPSTPNCVNSQAKDKEHFIEPIVITNSPSEAKDHILHILKEFKQSKVKVVEDNYIRAEFTSSILRFVDDVEFYFPDTKEGIIHVRSASRIGYSDLGVNRKRIEQIRSKIKAISHK